MTSPVDLEQLRTFVAIVDAGSFTKAAEDVFKTQSAVSMQMRRLEDRLGRKLFERNGRTIEMTESGQRLLSYARRMLTLSQETLSAFDENAMQGAVRIGLPDDYAERFLPEILARFARSNPLVELSIACEPSSNLAEAISKGRLDLALVSDCGTDGAKIDVMRHEPLHFVSSSAHDVHLGETVPLAVGRIDCKWRRDGIAALENCGRAYNVLFSSWSAQILISAVLSGLAVGVLPECALRPGMRVLGERDGFPRLHHTEIGVLRSPGASGAIVTALVEHIRESLANLAPANTPRIRPHQLPETRLIRSQRRRPGAIAAGW
ncbi:LysR substrate-binding domain-containing protein [Fulvimarina sp. 2208YS6-2-32]|uniref:LysR substrate-binding domain-containing protein n=1 Tax=Fulvimarina uroteuthidis TaxID=3098149 RepID=A0ABU5HZH8_9HYPH|nr:LysR substrate-binding domain-containing protein [Fulvimarina sp. 2208YS6-2-32]MDY8108190.1 LysR substrate-binding domain-containing protein [Fulvimarina sp. 2208YS6-2-32]